MIADHGDRVIDFDDLAHAGNLLRVGIVDAGERAAEHRAIGDGRVDHVGHAHVQSEHSGAVYFLRRIEALHRGADQLEIFRIFQRHVLRRGQFRRGVHQLSVTNAAVAGRMNHLPGFCMTAGRIDLPLLRGRADQYGACGRAGTAHRLPGIADRRRTAGELAAEQRVHEEFFVRRRVIERDRVERHFELFGDQHRDRRIHALPHLDLRHHQRDFARRVDLDEGVRLEHAVLRRLIPIAADHGFAGLLVLTGGRHAETQQQAAAGRGTDRDAELQERAACDTALSTLRRLRAVLCVEQSLGHVRLPSRLA